MGQLGSFLQSVCFGLYLGTELCLAGSFCFLLRLMSCLGFCLDPCFLVRLRTHFRHGSDFSVFRSSGGSSGVKPPHLLRPYSRGFADFSLFSCR